MFQRVGGRHTVLSLFVGEVRKGPPEQVSRILSTSFIVLAHEALEDGGVLGVDGQQVDMILRTRSEDELTGYDERLLVGQTNLLAP
jgi:hypothetical protein